MAIYELEQRILFDGAVAIQAAEAIVAEMQIVDAQTTNPDSSAPIPDASSVQSATDDTQTCIDELTGYTNPITNGTDPLAVPDNSELLILNSDSQNLTLNTETPALSTDNHQLSTNGHEVAFIASSVMDSQKIVDSLEENIESVYLGKNTNEINQITEYLSSHNDITAIHIISHGNNGYVTLNGQVIDSDYIDSHSEQFTQWSNSLTSDADILIYGCNTGKEESGQIFISKLAFATGADVLASTDGTGGLNGNWNLEYSEGSIETKAITVKGYEHNLTNYLVTNTSGSTAVENSLPWSIVQANLNPGADEITFDDSVDNIPITTNALLEITDDLTITGNGANKTIIQAAESKLIADHRVFRITSGAVTISDLTIRHGYSETLGGGGIANLGNLTLSNTTISNNAAPWGGGIYNSAGNIFLTESDVSDNYAIFQGGGVLNLNGNIFLDNTTISTNFSDQNGGGIYNIDGSIADISDTSILSGNIAEIFGGGIYNAGSSEINNIIISENNALAGGGVYNEGSLTADSLIISNNAVSDSGGGIYNKNSLTVISSTIQNNTAGENGGGILNSYNAALTLTTSTVTSNTSDYGGGLYNDGTTTIGASDVTNNTGLIYANNIINGADIPLVYLPVTSPNDPLYNELWGMKQISAPSVWNKFAGNNSIVVAVLDTGVDYLHPDLIDNMWHNPGEIPDNGIDDDHNGYIDDYWGWNFVDNTKDPMDNHSHGTHVAGTIGAVGNNDIGVAGVSWDVQIMALNIIGDSTMTKEIVDGIYYAVDMGAKILSCSWRDYGIDWASGIIEAFEYANSKGVLVIAAAGNESINNDLDPAYPASFDFPNIISIAATGNYKSLDYLASFSNYGAITVDFGAPGVNILSSVPPAVVVGKDYAYYDGTSMATPMVSGAAALLWSKFPLLTNLQVKSVLMDGVDKVDDLSGKMVTGGRLNLATSYQLAYNFYYRHYLTTGFNDGTQTSIISEWDLKNNYNLDDEISELIADSNPQYKILSAIQNKVTQELIQGEKITNKTITIASKDVYIPESTSALDILSAPALETERSNETSEPSHDNTHNDTMEGNDSSKSISKTDIITPAMSFESNNDYLSMIDGIIEGKVDHCIRIEKHHLFKTATDFYLEAICG